MEQKVLFNESNILLLNSRLANHIKDCLGAYKESEFSMTKMCIVGSRVVGSQNSDSDLDIALAYTGKLKEDVCFNILMAEPLRFKGIKIDFIPFSEGKGNHINLDLPHFCLFDIETVEESIELEFDAAKMMRLVEKDALLKFTFNDLNKKMPKEDVLQILFNGYVLDDSVMELEYMKE